MKRRIVALICLIALTFTLCSGISATGESGIILTSVNDSLLSVSANTMPVQRGGGWYVPYTVFADGSVNRSSLGLIAAYNASQQTMLVYDTNGHSLNFQVSVGFVTDENGTYYSQPALPINGTIYLPVKTICNKFNLSYSYISSTYNYLRIVSSSKMSDSLFASAAQELAGKMINTYKKQVQTSSGSSKPSSVKQPSSVTVTPPTSTTTETPTEELTPDASKIPSSVTLFFCGYPTSSASSIVDTLNQNNLSGNFFLESEDILEQDERVRKMLAGGHTIGLEIPASALTDSKTLTDYLDQANQNLFFVTGTTTRLCHIQGGSAGKLTANQLAALSNCGYRLWDCTLVSGGSQMTQNASTALHASEEPCRLGLDLSRSASQALTALAEDIRSHSIPTVALAESDTPKNSYNYTK